MFIIVKEKHPVYDMEVLAKQIRTLRRRRAEGGVNTYAANLTNAI